MAPDPTATLRMIASQVLHNTFVRSSSLNRFERVSCVKDRYRRSSNRRQGRNIMVRSVAVGFGAVTMLALAGSVVLGGQGTFGMRHRAAAQAAPVEAIQDRPAPVPASLQSGVAAPVAPAAFASSSRPWPQAHPAAPPAPRPQASSRPLGQSMDINQLLSLAQSPALANVLPTGGTTSGNAFLPSILQQFTDPVATPAPAQPELVDAALTQVKNGGGRDTGDGQK